jgi:hypothetical protein
MTIVPGMKESEIKKKYILSFCDPLSDETVAKQLDDSYEQFEKRLSELKEK